MCSSCPNVREKLALSTRQWSCTQCGNVHDRDINAAMNLKNMAMSSIVTACGGAGAGPVRKQRAKPASANQESSSRQG
jgi:putative transposase